MRKFIKENSIDLILVLLILGILFGIYAGFKLTCTPGAEITLPNPDPKREEVSTIDATAGGKL